MGVMQKLTPVNLSRLTWLSFTNDMTGVAPGVVAETTAASAPWPDMPTKPRQTPDMTTMWRSVFFMIPTPLQFVAMKYFLFSIKYF